MDTICSNEEYDSGFTRFLEEQFDMVLQDFEEFQKTSLPHTTDPMKVNDFLDPVFINSNDNSELPQSTQDKFTRLLNDFDEFENTMLPPYQMDPLCVENLNDSDFAGSAVQNRETIIKGKMQKAGQFSVGTHRDSTQNVTSYAGGGGGGGSAEGRGRGVVGSFATYANVMSYSGCGSSGGRVGPSMKYELFVQGSSGMNVWRHVGANMMPKAPRNRKRKYRYESEAETILRMERQKIKNRKAAAESFAKKQAHEAQLEAQTKKLHKKNEFLKKLLTFLEGNPRIDLPHKPLKRTISGPL